MRVKLNNCNRNLPIWKECTVSLLMINEQILLYSVHTVILLRGILEFMLNLVSEKVTYAFFFFFLMFVVF